ncbi:hypothetical protein, partial [Streptococcus sobrinus]|uniref:hypothetical protein n=1 Tax=Streptococcus sobrinus TaxID=1310 RepID=UPI001C3F62B3
MEKTKKPLFKKETRIKHKDNKSSKKLSCRRTGKSYHPEVRLQPRFFFCLTLSKYFKHFLYNIVLSQLCIYIVHFLWISVGLGQNPFAPIKTEDHLLVTLCFLGLVASPVIFDEIIGHKDQSHVNLDLP